MDETGWQAIGRIAKERRERLGLKQEELAQYEGPKVSTVGKFERATAAGFPLRTQHQMEKALGWDRGVIEEFVLAWDEGVIGASGRSDMDDWGLDLVRDNVPDMDRTPDGGRVVNIIDEAAQTIASVLRYVPIDQLDAAVRSALVALLPHLSTDGAEKLGRDLARGPGNSDDAPAARPTIVRPVDTDIYEDEAAYPEDGTEE